MPPRPASIKVRALQWLAQREHSRLELRDKLLRLLSRADRGLDAGPERAADDGAGGAAGGATDPAAEVEALLQWLESHGHLSQERFVESRIHARQTRFGNLRIRQELKHHGLTLDADAQQDLRHTEQARAEAVWRKKFGAPATDAAGRVRQMRFLAGRGFSADVVQRVVRGGGAVHDDAEPEGNRSPD